MATEVRELVSAAEARFELLRASAAGLVLAPLVFAALWWAPLGRSRDRRTGWRRSWARSSCSG